MVSLSRPEANAPTHWNLVVIYITKSSSSGNFSSVWDAPTMWDAERLYREREVSSTLYEELEKFFITSSYQLIAINIYIYIFSKTISRRTPTTNERVGEATTFHEAENTLQIDNPTLELFLRNRLMRMCESFRAFFCWLSIHMLNSLTSLLACLRSSLALFMCLQTANNSLYAMLAHRVTLTWLDGESYLIIIWPIKFSHARLVALMTSDAQSYYTTKVSRSSAFQATTLKDVSSDWRVCWNGILESVLPNQCHWAISVPFTRQRASTKAEYLISVKWEFGKECEEHFLN